jgi:hypothetical protein
MRPSTKRKTDAPLSTGQVRFQGLVKQQQARRTDKQPPLEADI